MHACSWCALGPVKEKVPLNMLKMRRFRSSCAYAKYHPGLCSPFIHSVVSNDNSGFINIREMSENFFFQGQGIVREFCDVLGKNEILQKAQGNVRELYIST